MKEKGIGVGVIILIVVVVVAGGIGGYIVMSRGDSSEGGSPTEGQTGEESYTRSEGDNFKYQVYFSGPQSDIVGTLEYRIKSISEDSYTYKMIPKGDISEYFSQQTNTRKENEIIANPEIVEEGEFLGKADVETDIGTIEADYYRLENQVEEGRENFNLYLESETNTMIKMRTESPDGFTTKVILVSTNVEPLKEKFEGETGGGDEWSTYTNQDFHYKIRYPSSWIKEVLHQGAMLNLRSTGEKNRVLTFSINSQYENSLEDFLENSINSLQAQAGFENATFSVENGTLDGHDAKVVDIQNVTIAREGKEYTFRQGYVLAFADIDGKQHPVGLVFMAEENDDEAWDEIFPKIIEDFEFI